MSEPPRSDHAGSQRLVTVLTPTYNRARFLPSPLRAAAGILWFLANR